MGDNAAGCDGPCRRPLDRPLDWPSPLRHDAGNVVGDDNLARPSLEAGHHDRLHQHISHDDGSDDCDDADEHAGHDHNDRHHHDHSDDGWGRNDNRSYEDGGGAA